MAVVAEPLLFSGTRNPRATLTREEEAGLRERYAAAGRDPSPAEAPPSTLGYAGVLIALEGDLDKGPPLHALRVGGGVVEEFMEDGTVRTYADRSHIEDFVRRCIEHHVPGVRAIIEGMNAGPGR